jgi:hypothetical protein
MKKVKSNTSRANELIKVFEMTDGTEELYRLEAVIMHPVLARDYAKKLRKMCNCSYRVIFRSSAPAGYRIYSNRTNVI